MDLLVDEVVASFLLHWFRTLDAVIERSREEDVSWRLHDHHSLGNSAHWLYDGPNSQVSFVIFLLSTRVSNELGAGRPHAARLAVRVAVFMAISEGLVIGLVLVCVRNIWGHVYSNEEEVIKYVAKMLLVISVSNFFDGIQCVLSGVARGCGWQTIGACVNLGAYYIVGIPSAYLVAFILHVGGMGLWLGITCGILVQVAAFALPNSQPEQCLRKTERSISTLADSFFICKPYLRGNYNAKVMPRQGYGRVMDKVVNNNFLDRNWDISRSPHPLGTRWPNRPSDCFLQMTMQTIQLILVTMCKSGQAEGDSSTP
uniref:Protein DETOXIFICATION n=1 Tax=Oryza punctata TaxID=4537 RepID=A0A0E0LBV7_ORYPU